MNIDSDLDGISDGEEIGGNMANLSMATTRNEGCSLSGSASGSPSSMFYLFGMMMLAVKAASRRIRKTLLEIRTGLGRIASREASIKER